MRVLYLVSPPTRPERITRYVFIDEEIAALARAGVEAHVVSPGLDDDEQRDRARRRALPPSGAVQRWKGLVSLARWAPRIPRRAWSVLPRLLHAVRIQSFAADLVRAEGIDLIHSHFGWPDGFGGFLTSAATGTPLIATLRGKDLHFRPSLDYGRRSEAFFDRNVRALLRRADRTTYFSRYMRDQGLALGAPASRAFIIDKGVDCDRFRTEIDRASARAELGLPDGPLILTVGGLVPLKGIHHVLEALQRLSPARDFHLVVCGEGPQRGELQQLSRRAGLEGRVHFQGWVDRDRIPRYFAACDVLVLASLLEAAGNVVLEAMASGRPVICTDSGGPRDYVENGVTGFLVPVADPQALAERIDTLLADPDLRGRMGQEGRRRVLERHRYGKMIEEFIRLYEEVLTASRR
jgi:glycosyltransferase involved in cell wall biosynthesis